MKYNMYWSFFGKIFAIFSKTKGPRAKWIAASERESKSRFRNKRTGIIYIFDSLRPNNPKRTLTISWDNLKMSLKFVAREGRKQEGKEKRAREGRSIPLPVHPTFTVCKCYMQDLEDLCWKLGVGRKNAVP